MAEYIERVKLIEKIANTPFGLNCTGESDDYKEGVLRGLVAKQNNVIDMIKDQPVADVAPVVHGKWILRGKWLRCSQCDEKALLKETGETGGFHEYEQVRSDYCPMCGAKMDLEGEHGGLHK